MVILNLVRDEISTFNGAAHYLWRAMHCAGRGQIARALQRRYGLEGRTAARDAAVMIAEWERLGLLGEIQPDDRLSPAQPAERVLSQATARLDIELGCLRARLKSSEPYTEQLKEMFASISTETAGEDASEFLLQSDDDGLGRLTVDQVEVLDRASPAAVLGRLCTELLERVSPDGRLCAVLHAGAVARAGKAVVLAAPSGSGKSTLTAYLAARGFEGLGDDMLGLRDKDLAAVTLPIPLTIKSGSVDVLRPMYPGLKDGIQSLPVQRASPAGAPHQATALVFPRYQHEAALVFEPVSVEEALSRLLQDNLFLGAPAQETRLRRCLEWLCATDRRSLVYGDLRDAERCIGSLLAR